MFEGTRLSYIVPGYTGHIPKNLTDDEPAKRNEGEYQLPGYQGYIPSIKSENMYGKTYGKLTYTISSQNYHKGQDVEPKDRYNSSYSDIFVNQRDVQQRTAAEMVGVIPTNEKYKKPVPIDQLNIFFGIETPEDVKLKSRMMFQPPKDANDHLNQLSEEQQFEKNVKNFFGSKEESGPIKLETPLPGYTGTLRKIVAGNIFGQTFANSIKTAEQMLNQSEEERHENFKTQSSLIPNIKK